MTTDDAVSGVSPSYWTLCAFDIHRSGGLAEVTMVNGRQVRGFVNRQLSGGKLGPVLHLHTVKDKVGYSQAGVAYWQRDGGWVVIDTTLIAAMRGIVANG